MLTQAEFKIELHKDEAELYEVSMVQIKGSSIAFSDVREKVKQEFLGRSAAFTRPSK